MGAALGLRAGDQQVGVMSFPMLLFLPPGMEKLIRSYLEVPLDP